MREFKYVIKDAEGIHARPAGMFVKEAAAFPCKVTIEKERKRSRRKENLRCYGTCSKMRTGDYIENRRRERGRSYG